VTALSLITRRHEGILPKSVALTRPIRGEQADTSADASDAACPKAPTLSMSLGKDLMSRQKRLTALGKYWGREAPADVIQELCSKQAIPDVLHLELESGRAISAVVTCNRLGASKSEQPESGQRIGKCTRGWEPDLCRTHRTCSVRPPIR
jgi:hypothetical protein